MLVNQALPFVEEVYLLISKKGKLFHAPDPNLPLNGVYLFFEKGQRLSILNQQYDRVVRIGINEKPNRFRDRVRGHYRGNIEGSVFRENVGWALLETSGRKPKENYGTKKQYRLQNSGGPLEEDISKLFSTEFTFKAFDMDFEKLYLDESTLLAAFSIYYQCKIFSKQLDLGDWLGLHSYSRQDRIKRSGLWNCEGVILIRSIEPLTLERPPVGFDPQMLSESNLSIVLADLSQRLV